MLTACHEESEVLALGAERDRVKALSRAGALRCPACEQLVSFRAGERNAWHFAHRPGLSPCPLEDDPDYRPESRLHLQAKRVLARWLREASGPGVEVDTEVLIPETDQVADVLLTRSPFGERRAGAPSAGRAGTPRRFAFEVQCSPISGRRWQERSGRYAEAGVADTWLLAGKKHLTLLSEPEDGKARFRLRDLPLKIYRERGRLLVLVPPGFGKEAGGDSEGGREGEPAPAEALLPETHLTSVQGLANRYAYADGNGPEAHAEAMEGQPVPEQPAWLGPGTQPWTRVQPEAEITVRPPHAHSRLLMEASLDLEAPAPLFLATSAAARREGVSAWGWEAANLQWHREWTRRWARWKADEERRRARAFRERDALVGRGVYSGLCEILPAARALASRGQASGQAFRNAPALPEGVGRWPTRLWTPLANLELPLDWVFGRDRRLWQMVVYCTHFYHHYAKRYREEQGISAKGYSRLAPGYALKALGAKRLMYTKATRRLSSRLDTLSEWIEPRAALDFQGGLRSTIELHDVRRLVAASYFDRLAEIGFMTSYQPSGALAVLRKLRAALGAARRAFRRYGEAQPPKRVCVRLGYDWLGLAQEVAGVQLEDLYGLWTPFVPPYFKPDVHAAFAEGLAEGTLSFREQGVAKGGEPLIEFDWVDSAL